MFHHILQGVIGVIRNIKETMYVQVNDPSPNRNLGKYQLLHIYNRVLQDTITPAQITQLYHPYMGHAPYIYHTTNGGYMQLQFISMVPCGCAFLPPFYFHNNPCTPQISHTPLTPLHPHFSSAFFGKYIYLFM